jgi:peptidyl-prolyl cis-trans isomerase B (cyclophilin B)
MLRWILSCFLAMSVLLTSCTNAGGVSASASPTASESQSATASPTANSKPTAIATIPTSPKPSANPENSSLEPLRSSLMALMHQLPLVILPI